MPQIMRSGARMPGTVEQIIGAQNRQLSIGIGGVLPSVRISVIERYFMIDYSTVPTFVETML